MEFGTSHLIFLAAGLALGAGVVAILSRTKLAVAKAAGKAEGDIERATLSEQVRGLNAQVTALKAELEDVQNSTGKLNAELATLREANGSLSAIASERGKRVEDLEAAERIAAKARDDLAEEVSRLKRGMGELQIELEHEKKQSTEKLGLLAEAKEQLSNQFKVLAADILDEKTKKFTEQNKSNLDQLLGPLKEKLTSFQSKVEEVYVKEAEGRSALAEQVKHLTQLNSTLRDETHNLTLALTGDRKAQGGYGELLLDDVLERAGLREGQHYQRQVGMKSDDGGAHVIPDVVINLPGDRHLVVDSKMTLPDYKLFSQAQDAEERDLALRRHLAAIRAHIKGLSEKNYQSLYGLRSLDFVVMFMPLEPAFMVAVTNDADLFHHAWEKNVLLVSPSTLLFVVRTVANLWRQEDLSRNARDISARGAELYDRLVGFVTDLQKVGERIQQAQDSYMDAKKKLSEGVGNVVRQAEMLKQLGVKPTKALPSQWAGDLESAEGNAVVRSIGKGEKSAPG